MDMKNLSKTQKLTMSGAIMAIYIVVMYFTQSFAFGQYQVRIATALYGVAYLFPFLVVPLGLSNLIATIYFLLLFYANRGRSVLSLVPRRASLRRGIPGEVLATGLPACLMTLCENISYAVLDNLMALSGTVMQAGLGVAKKVNMLAHCMARGMAQGVLPLIGYNYAAGNYKRMRSAVRISAGISVVLSALWMAASLVLSRQLIEIFIQHESNSVLYGARFLRILCLGGPFSAFAYAIISFFQAVGESRKSFVLAILRKGLLDIPLMFILLKLIPVYGTVWATPIADVLCCATALALFTRFLKKLVDRPRLNVYLD